jgi:hypothetical protein
MYAKMMAFVRDGSVYDLAEERQYMAQIVKSVKLRNVSRASDWIQTMTQNGIKGIEGLTESHEGALLDAEERIYFAKRMERFPVPEFKINGPKTQEIRARIKEERQKYLEMRAAQRSKSKSSRKKSSKASRSKRSRATAQMKSVDATSRQMTGATPGINFEGIVSSARSGSSAAASRATKAKLTEIERPPILVESYSGDSRGVRIELIPSRSNLGSPGVRPSKFSRPSLHGSKSKSAVKTREPQSPARSRQ